MLILIFILSLFFSSAAYAEENTNAASDVRLDHSDWNTGFGGNGFDNAQDEMPRLQIDKNPDDDSDDTAQNDDTGNTAG